MLTAVLERPIRVASAPATAVVQTERDHSPDADPSEDRRHRDRLLATARATLPRIRSASNGRRGACQKCAQRFTPYDLFCRYCGSGR
jgi:hypothetical protein